jgi:hypothetical protein
MDGSDAAEERREVPRPHLDGKERGDLVTQQIIDDLARRSRGREHAAVLDELVERLGRQGLLPCPQPWLDAVAAAAIMGNAYVVTALTARRSDVPPPSTHQSGTAIS